jgi:N-acetylglucosaminyl-diphospho-decaprenol L-rhamnosyltransferase
MCSMSIVIATRNRADSLLYTLSKLAQLPEQAPVIVVDNHSEDDTVARVQREFPTVTLLALPNNKGAAARNDGVVAAQTPYVAFCDDDSFWEPGALAKAVTYFEQYPRLGLLAGKILVGEARKIDPVCEALAKSPLPRLFPLPGPAILGFIACGAIVRKEAFLAVGGFDERFGIGGEEALLAVDLLANGWGLSYVEDVVGYHFPSPVRNPGRRTQVQIRNDLWFSWLRRPWSTAFQQTLRLYRQSQTNPDMRKGWLEAMKSLPQIIQYRREMPGEIEQQLQLINS